MHRRRFPDARDGHRRLSADEARASTRAAHRVPLSFARRLLPVEPGRQFAHFGRHRKGRRDAIDRDVALLLETVARAAHEGGARGTAAMPAQPHLQHEELPGQFARQPVSHAVALPRYVGLRRVTVKRRHN